MQYSIYPISMGMFNQKLELCQSPQDIKDTFEFLKDSNITLTLFIKSVEFLIQSFTDLNFKNWGFFVKKTSEIFSNEKNRDALNSLQEKVTAKFRELYPQLVKAGPAPVKIEKPHSKVDWELVFTQLSEFFTDNASQRLEDAFQIANAKSPYEKAEALQLILNFLILETDLVKYASSYGESVSKAISTQELIREGCDRIIRLDAKTEITLFEIPLEIEETEEFAFWLKLSPYIELSLDGDRVFAFLKLIREKDLNVNEFTLFLKNLLKESTNEKIRFIIEKWLMNLEFRDLLKKLYNSVSFLSDFINEVIDSSLVMRPYSEDFESNITPISFSLFKLVKDHFIEIAKTSARDAPESEISVLHRLMTVWETQKHHQSALFEEANRQFWALIRDNPKLKRVLLQCAKDLTGPAELPLKPMRQYPNFNEKETVEKSPVIVLPKIKSSATPKKKKNIAHKICESKADDKTIESGPLTVEPTVSSAIQEEKSQGKPFPFDFEQRVERWDNHTFGEPFSQELFPEYYDKNLAYQKLMHLFHAPHPLVDQFTSLGIEGTWLNVQKNKNDLRYVIPAEITFENKKYRGLIVYAIDRNTNLCYHRFFTEKIDRDVLCQVVTKIFNENDFPDLREAINMGETPSQKPKIIDNSSLQIDSNCVVITDHERGVMIKLFKT